MLKLILGWCMIILLQVGYLGTPGFLCVSFLVCVCLLLLSFFLFILDNLVYV